MIAVGWLAIGAGAAHAQHACDAATRRRLAGGAERRGDRREGRRAVSRPATTGWSNASPRCCRSATTSTPVGNYSLRSYSLDPFTKAERVVLCHAGARGLSEPVAPYAGPCPPK